MRQVIISERYNITIKETDDISTINELNSVLEAQGFNIIYNSQNDSKGFDETSFNQASKQHRYELSIITLLLQKLLF